MEDVDLFNESGYETPTKKPRTLSTSDSIPIKDNVHGHILVPPLCRMIMDTPQFARLRSVKQLGCTHYVYPTATHSRFQHSLGVMHLAGKYYEFLTQNSPDVMFDPLDHLCVQVAGLIHDMGHGPYSHLWEQFVTEANPGSGWTHEKASLDQFKHLLKVNDIPLRAWNVKERDVDFIMELVKGPLSKSKNSWPYKGRSHEKAFLYEIIANHVCGIDVDKMDYLHRDGKGMGLTLKFEIERLFHNASIGRDDTGKSFISFRKKVMDEVVNLYKDRSGLHDKGYQHKTVKIIERMTLDMLLAADPVLDIVKTEDGGWVRMSQVYDDPREFESLSDDYVEKSIQCSRGPALEKARGILDRIYSRELYSVVFNKDYLEFGRTVKMCKDELLKLSMSRQMSIDVEQDVAVMFRKINMGGGNPLEKVVFNEKSKPGVHFRMSKEMIKKSNVIPSVTSKVSVLVVCRKKGKDAFKEVTELANKWGGMLDEMKDTVAAPDYDVI